VTGAVLLLAVALPHVQQVAPGVWAAGFSDRRGSANGGWFTTATETVLIDLDLATYGDEVRRITGKPVRATIPDSVPVKRYGGALHLTGPNVLFAGPEVVNGPHAKLAGRDISAWLAILTQLEKLHPAVVVPGFGSWGGPEIIARQRRFLAELRHQVAYGISMGRPVEAIEREVLLPATYYSWMPYDNPRPEDIRHVYSELTRPPGPATALVLIGDRYHEPEHIEDGLRPVFEATGVTAQFTVDVRALSAANLAKVQLLVILRDGMLWPDGPSKPYQIWMTPEQEKAVVAFVERGGAFLNLHNSMGLYPKDGPYLNLVGGRYIGHGPLERFQVEVVDRGHPITKGVEDYFAADEQHTPPYDEGRVRLLLRNRSDDGKTAAAGWAYEPGRGRLCHLASGHTRESLEHPMFQRLLRNAVQWCLRRE
jgi:type 1 glutamine amidotransferase